MLTFAYQARSPQLAATANLIVGGWLTSLAVWRWVPSALHALGFSIIDIALATAFFFMSRGRWFPVPLFYLHGALVAYGAYSLLIGSSAVWVTAFLNRAFEIELAYILACAIFRISRLREN